jgi:hypothetical protein
LNGLFRFTFTDTLSPLVPPPIVRTLRGVSIRMSLPYPATAAEDPTEMSRIRVDVARVDVPRRDSRVRRPRRNSEIRIQRNSYVPVGKLWENVRDVSAWECKPGVYPKGNLSRCS